MQLTKYAHACVSLAGDQGRIVIDPGTLTPDAADAVAAAEAVLITHEHFDHFDEELLAQALQARPELRVYGPESVVGRWQARRGQVTAVAAGDRIAVAGFDIGVFGELHAMIHRDMPRVANVGYLVDERVYHPGDAYHVPDAPVETLLLPTSGPWAKLGEGVDYVREVAPKQAVQIHELLLSDLGQQMTRQMVGQGGLTDVPVTIVPIGETITV
ncbi:MBL fold metallo-hydrolase [Catenulispora sp. NF23]|uniref:MBL fold metallo-hydrolase n=1 Tax=Catenulispora pinistramenti TaxID=2705254 RepID=A0ABS5KSR2_9ACTN|nr:MBL fold metallo-hydrolase [Catenulispora pinistramenti]MBS2538696.1 MBL fold metallo-hydrolase [Catenulispora pinistramenti]MBS2549069.1 MBL fold metallo-hydrolase [Catenulispora pinistramenti]